MTPEYIYRPKAWWDNDAPIIEGKTIYEAESGPIKTGLLDQNGNPLYRVFEKQPIGFHAGKATKG